MYLELHRSHDGRQLKTKESLYILFIYILTHDRICFRKYNLNVDFTMQLSVRHQKARRQELQQEQEEPIKRSSSDKTPTNHEVQKRNLLNSSCIFLKLIILGAQIRR